MRRSRVTLLCLSLLATGAVPATALERSSAPLGVAVQQEQRAALAVREDADHSEHYFTSSDGLTRLHADVLLPKGTPADADLPVVLTVSPYTNHNGSTTDVDPTGTGPNPRFFDFLDLTGALSKGYAYVMVDLPGFGGSGGCNDWGGAREQGAVRAAVEWAAGQSWSNGRVALLGKSYDAWTGLMGVAQQPEGLAAVVAMEPVYSGYRYKYMNGVKRPNFAATMALFQAIDAKPGRPTDSPEYLANSVPLPACYATNMVGTLEDNPSSPFWGERDLVPTADSKTTPVFLMQGFLEANTKQDGAFEYWNGLGGEESRAWFGQFDHVRGWETNTSASVPRGDGSRFQTGRGDFVEQLVRFLDEHLKGEEPAVEDAAVEVQDSLGRWREEAQWPPADSRLLETRLNTGTYTDSGSGNGQRPTAAQGVWSVSAPLQHDVWLAGEPRITVSATSVPNANLAVNVYDIDPEGRATMVSRGVSLLRGVGTKTVSFRMYGQDWPVPAGHRLGVLLSSANTDEFQHVATRQPVTVERASIALPFLTRDRKDFLEDGTSTPRLEQFRAAATSVLPAQLLSDSEAPFALPGRLAGSGSGNGSGNGAR